MASRRVLLGAVAIVAVVLVARRVRSGPGASVPATDGTETDHVEAV